MILSTVAAICSLFTMLLAAYEVGRLPGNREACVAWVVAGIYSFAAALDNISDVLRHLQ